jgi:DHA1 family bicyclomycin/chloramphenicol resistance-like MFS transporter
MGLHQREVPADSFQFVAAPRLTLTFPEFIGLIALMMALTALSIDIMLPALPEIGAALGVTNPNDRQIVVISYVLGFSAGQLVYGPLSDRFGRKPVLLIGLAIFVAGSLTALLATSFTALLAARIVQGLGAASPRVMAMAIVRDVFSGRQMARVMSFAMMVFIVIPVFAPAIGQGLIWAGSWRWTFDVLLIVGILCAAWASWRLPETADTATRGPPPSLGQSLRQVVTNPQTAGYAVAAGFMFGCLMGYVSSAQQVFVGVFGLGEHFPIAFGAVASVMAVASFTNANIVERLGMRLVSHTALVGFAAVSAALAVAAALGWATLPLFCGLVASTFFLFGLIAPNFNALAMEPQGRNAGMASSVIGFYATGAGAIFGGTTGHFFNGTVLPLAMGFAGLSLLALLTVLAIEGPKGMFRPHPRPAP